MNQKTFYLILIILIAAFLTVVSVFILRRPTSPAYIPSMNNSSDEIENSSSADLSQDLSGGGLSHVSNTPISSPEIPVVNNRSVRLSSGRDFILPEGFVYNSKSGLGDFFAPIPEGGHTSAAQQIEFNTTLRTCPDGTATGLYTNGISTCKAFSSGILLSGTDDGPVYDLYKNLLNYY